MKSLTKILAPLLMLSIILASCTASTSMAVSNKDRISNPTIPEGNLKTLVDGNNAFALDIYQALHSESGNLILSPYSISLALAMTYAGARDQTEVQMAHILHFSPSQSQLHPAFNSLDLTLEKSPENFEENQQPMTLNIANAVWAEQTFSFQQDFLDTIALNYGAGVHLADFINKYEPARQDINNWVSDQTQKKIKDLLPENLVNTDTRMVLINAIYFKADWLAQFDANSTSDAPFFLLDDSQVTVKMMYEHMSIPYIKGDGYQAVELPYAGDTAAMDIIAPDAGTFEAFESSFDKEAYDATLSGMQSTTVELGLPKFTFTRDFNLSEVLGGMGMPDAFDPDLADFSGMTGKKDLYIGNVVHKAFVAVDEKGTEAAAATAVIMMPASAIESPMVLEVNHPFIFIIRDLINGQILFIGRVLNPAQN
jgi:serine protease inhibitor